MDHFVSVDEVFSKALLLAKNEGHVSHAKESSKVEGQIKAQLIAALHCINAHVESMHQVLEQKVFFNGPDELAADFNKMQKHLLNKYGNQLGRFLEAAQKKIAEAQNSYRKLNEQITEEATNIEFAQNLAVKPYQRE
jgi:hemerythrin-like domain-containing protein